MGEQIQLHVDENGSIAIPPEVQEQLVPGAVLTVERRENGAITLRVEVESQAPAEDEPMLIEKDGILVIRGKVPDDFNWEAFLHESRERPLYGFEHETA